MKVRNICSETRIVTIEWRGKSKTLPIRKGFDKSTFSIEVVGRVGRTGTKPWACSQLFYLKEDGRWHPGTVIGGQRGRSITPVCFPDEVASFFGTNTIHR